MRRPVFRSHGRITADWRRPFHERHTIVEMVELPRVQPRLVKDLFGRPAEATLREAWNAAGQAHFFGAAKVEVIVAELQKEAVNISTSYDSHRARPAADSRACLFKRGAGRVPKFGVRVVGVGRQTADSPRKDKRRRLADLG
jgi:hypothetical protein